MLMFDGFLLVIRYLNFRGGRVERNQKHSFLVSVRKQNSPGLFF